MLGDNMSYAEDGVLLSSASQGAEMDFYVGKSRDLPRFTYRNFIDAMRAHTDEATRARFVNELTEFFATMQPQGDWKKMKWSLPAEVRQWLSHEQQEVLDRVLREKGQKRNEKLIEIYPHCADEFSTEIAFLDAAFGMARHGLISKQTSVLTIGSCFATNIAKFLAGKHYNVERFSMAEDLNSPFSNAKLLSVCAADHAEQERFLKHWIGAVYPSEVNHEEQVSLELERLTSLHRLLKSSEFLIVTCGNVIDYFIPEGLDGFHLGPWVAPKFLSIGSDEAIGSRAYVTNKFKEAGAVFRMGNYQETQQAMEAQYRAIRAINPTAHLLFTLSPVPIDSAIGIHQNPRMGAVEMDCISKSSLRVALAERMQIWSESDTALHYFPSFEIVRWIGACMEGRIFGAQDAASRHVSQEILSGVYRYFLHKYGVDGQ